MRQTVQEVDLLWRSESPPSLEHFSYRSGPEGNSLSGTVVLSRRGTPTTISYHVEANQRWDTQAACFTATDLGGHARVEVVASHGGWQVDGVTRHDLASCTEIDLGWTPSTNTLPIRRTALRVGESATAHVAWITFPDFVVQPAVQRYTRTGEREWVYESDDFTADLVTDERGLVLRYGDDLWTTVGRS